MSGEDSKSNNDMASMMEVMRSMFSDMNTSLSTNINNLDQRNINNMNSLREDLNSNIMQSSEQIHMRMEALQEKINSRSNSKANSRAVSPGALAARLNARIKEEPIDLADLVMDTPRATAPDDEISMTAIIKNNEDAERFSQVNPLAQKQRKPLESKRMNTHAFRDSLAATSRKITQPSVVHSLQQRQR